MIVHKLKSWPVFFQPVKDGDKRFEIRINDRDFEVDDQLCLEEWDPKVEAYTGQWALLPVTYIMDLGVGVLDELFGSSTDPVVIMSMGDLIDHKWIDGEVAA